MTLKDNQPDLLAEAQRTTATQALHPPAADQSAELQLWYVPQLDWPVAGRDITVVKSVRDHSRRRWQIDADVFQTITTNSALKQPSLHQGYDQALLILTMIRVLAFTLSQVFFHRQIRSHFRKPVLGFRDLARRIAYQFLVPRPTFNSS
jgi:hypothetical protein